MKHRWLLRLVLLFCDLALLEAAFFAVYWWRFETGMFRNPVGFSAAELVAPSLVVTTYWIFLFAWFGLYRFDPLQSRATAVLQAFQGAAFGALLLFILTFDPNRPLPGSRIVLVAYGLAVFGIVSGNRVGLLTILRELRIHGIGCWRTLLVGCGLRARGVLRHIALHPELGLGVSGKLTVNHDDGGLDTLTTLGTFSTLRSVLARGGYDAVLLAPDDRDERQLARMLKLLREFRVRAFIAADQYRVLVGEVKPRRVYGHPLVKVRPEVLSVVERVLKRTVDLAFSVCALLVTAPLWLLLAIIIPRESSGPVIFRQERVGLNGRIFTLFKFRSMRRDAERQTGAVLAVADDPRVTRVGRWMRPLRLDEIPQLINVLLGQMSLVGPRPERLEFVQRFIQEIPLYERRLNVKPGLTGWSQVHLKYDRGADQIPVKLKYDFYYIENMSLPLDMKIMFMTLFVILRGEGL